MSFPHRTRLGLAAAFALLALLTTFALLPAPPPYTLAVHEQDGHEPSPPGGGTRVEAVERAAR